MFHLNNQFLKNPLKIKEHSYLYQAGIFHCPENGGTDTHIQPDLFELTAVNDGKGLIYTNDVVTEVKRGDIYVSFPGDMHRVSSATGSTLNYSFFSFNTTDPELKDALEDVLIKFANPEHRVIRDDNIQSLIANAVAEVNSKGVLSDVYLDSIIKQIIVNVVRGFSKWNPVSLAPSTDHQLCYYVMNYIDTHVFSLKNISELSKVTNYNYSYLSNLFKRTTGSNIADYYKKKRMEKAKYLVESKIKLTKIAELLSYSSVYAFSKAYKAYYGHSPITDRFTED